MTNNNNLINGNLLTTDSEGYIKVNQSEGIDWNKLLNDTFKITNDGRVFLSDNTTLIQSDYNLGITGTIFSVDSEGRIQVSKGVK